MVENVQWDLMAGYVRFQLRHAVYPLLNVGVGANPARFRGPRVTHVDLDLWKYRRMVQADAHDLPFKDNVFASAIAGDVFEHLLYPARVLQEMRRVAPILIITVFEEWRLPGPGQHLVEARKNFDEAPDGYDPYLKRGELLERFSEDEMPHAQHINQFTLAALLEMFQDCGLKVLVQEEDCPGVHEGHSMKNWMFVLERA